MHQTEERPRVQLYAEGAVGQLLEGVSRRARSSRVKLASERYLAVCQYEKPALVEGDWEALAFYPFGVPLTTEVLRKLSATVQGVSLVRPFHRKVSSGLDRLLRQLDTMSFGQRVALAEALERRWKVRRQKRHSGINGFIRLTLSEINHIDTEHCGYFIDQRMVSSRTAYVRNHTMISGWIEMGWMALCYGR